MSSCFVRLCVSEEPFVLALPPIVVMRWPSKKCSSDLKFSEKVVRPDYEIQKLISIDALFPVVYGLWFRHEYSDFKKVSAMSASISGEDPHFEGHSDQTVTKDRFGRPVIEIDDMLFHYKGSKMAATGGRQWPKGRIPILFDGVSEDRQAQIRRAADLWAPAGIEFPDKGPNDYAYLQIIASKKNLTTVGFGIVGPHTCELVSWGDIPILAHELGHAIGLEHEQSRSDRDNYIVVNVENLTDLGMDQFAKSLLIRSQTAYDVSSIMHYKQFIGDKRFINNAEEPVFYLKPGVVVTGPAGMGSAPTKLDIAGVAKFYGAHLGS